MGSEKMKGCVWAIAACAFIASCLVIAVGIFIVLCWDEKCGPLEGKWVPNAHWIGGSDGGYWYELKEVRGDTMHFCIYNEWTLEKEVDADFVDEKGAGIMQNERWFDYISSYDGYVIQLTLVSADRNYTLRKVETY